MKLKMLKYFTFCGLFLWSIAVLLKADPQTVNSTNNSQRQLDSLTLVLLYQATDGSNWTTPWDLKEPMENWYGVHLNKTGCVRCLDLDGEPSCSTRSGKGNGLKGKLPNLELPQLSYLLLANNSLEGDIPNFTALPKLRILRLSCNKFSGAIPNFDRLPILKSLELDYNQLTDGIPDFTKLPELESLYLLANKLEGQVPDFRHLPSLKYFIANQNMLSGSIPDFSKCPSLLLLKLSDNQLNGPLPDYTHLPKLKNLNLSFNQLEGPVFDWSSLNQLEYLQLSNNRLEGTIPDLFMLRSLKVLDLSKNELEGPVPDLSNLEGLSTVRLQQNRLSSCPEMENLPALKELELNGNFLNLSDVLGNTAFYKSAVAYSPQRIDGIDSSLMLKAGTDKALQADWITPVADNLYAWYKDGALIEENVGDPKLWLVDLTSADAGHYYCRMSNPRLPGLVLISPLLKVKIKEDQPKKEEVLAEEVKPTEWFNQLSKMEEKLEGKWKISGNISPNGDGNNDYFKIIGLDEKEDAHRYELMIFSASGQLIYQAKPYRNNWAGTFQQSQNPVPAGIYFYSLKVPDANQPVLSGSLVVVR